MEFKMKTRVKIMIAFTLMMILTFIGYNVYKSQKKQMHLSALAMANVEALARIELPEVVVTCGASGGQSWAIRGDCSLGWFLRYDNCTFTGYMHDSCYTPCD